MSYNGKKFNGVIFHIEFKKAYDKVKWSFLQQTLRMKGFLDVWRALIHSVSPEVACMDIKFNDDVDHYFQKQKGLRQGDPSCPMFLNIVADMLAVMIDQAKANGLIDWVVPHPVDGGLSILQ